MQVSDPIADMLARIRNAIMAGATTVSVPSSKIKRAILDRLLDEGYVEDIDHVDDGRQGILNVRLKVDSSGRAVIDGLKRASKPGRRLYVRATEIPKSRSGYGTVILSTSKGVMTDRQAREQGVGGEVLCSVW